ncbi:hypothetical protein BDZ89DRAFT_536898 [Hymenopellis radicata]|nr:hypothetical protein BDZ89DRAFT_536898 [Hymenopellis radicata]
MMGKVILVFLIQKRDRCLFFLLGFFSYLTYWTRYLFIRVCPDSCLLRPSAFVYLKPEYSSSTFRPYASGNTICIHAFQGILFIASYSMLRVTLQHRALISAPSASIVINANLGFENHALAPMVV